MVLEFGGKLLSWTEEISACSVHCTCLPCPRVQYSTLLLSLDGKLTPVKCFSGLLNQQQAPQNRRAWHMVFQWRTTRLSSGRFQLTSAYIIDTQTFQSCDVTVILSNVCSMLEYFSVPPCPANICAGRGGVLQYWRRMRKSPDRLALRRRTPQLDHKSSLAHGTVIKAPGSHCQHLESHPAGPKRLIERTIRVVDHKSN